MEKLDPSWKTLLETKEILDRLGIKFWLCGTTLDRVLKKEIACKLNRMNIRVKAEDWSSVMCEEFKKRGFECQERERKINDRSLPIFVVVSKGGMKVLIRLMYYYPPEDVYLLLDQDAKERLGKVPASFYKKESFTEFLNTEFRVPCEPAKLLQFFRGKREILEQERYISWFCQYLEKRREK